MAKIRVGVNGYGTIGKRVATAVAAQDDMELIGVTKTRPNFEALSAIRKGYDIYVPDESVKAFADAGVKIAGTLKDLYAKVDIMVDCTPGNVGEMYRDQYKAAGVKAIFQGGEDHSLTGISFNSTANYSESWGAQLSRVVSCNTTGLLRTLNPIDKKFKVENAYVTIVRRAADPGDSKNGPINGLEPSVSLPTHHGPDVQSIMPWLHISTMAIKASTTLMHVHTVVAQLATETTTEEVLEVLRKAPRVRLVKSKDGIKTTAQIMELARDLGRDRSDMYEIVVWEDGVKVVGNTLYYYQAVHQESDVIPENIDCIRSMCKAEQDPCASIRKTNAALGISKNRGVPHGQGLQQPRGLRLQGQDRPAQGGH
ncbi:MAG: type II glyceraldehyde-3-phosphate dehydrogenase [Candidatus Methanomethylophilaceae archaeon]|nr:type II glyceraldehyde-3-phosphate dehydrogenase [Candidatus Methanomethylophilaceae archaeon]